MTTLLEQTWNLNITPRQGPNGELLLEVEGGLLMTGQDFAVWLHKASQSPEPALRPASRNSIEVWRDTRESPQPKAKLREMDEYAELYRKMKRKVPRESQEQLQKRAKEALEVRKTFLESWAELALEDLLGREGQAGEDAKGAGEAQQPTSRASLGDLR